MQQRYVEIYSLRKNGARGADVLGTVPPMGDATCSAQETLAHISQSWKRTRFMRSARHESILDYIIITKTLSKGCSVVREPVILTRVGMRKPDLIAEMCDLDCRYMSLMSLVWPTTLAYTDRLMRKLITIIWLISLIGWMRPIEGNREGVERCCSTDACRVLTLASCMFKAISRSTIRAGRTF